MDGTRLSQQVYCSLVLHAWSGLADTRPRQFVKKPSRRQWTRGLESYREVARHRQERLTRGRTPAPPVPRWSKAGVDTQLPGGSGLFRREVRCVCFLHIFVRR